MGSRIRSRAETGREVILIWGLKHWPCLGGGGVVVLCFLGCFFWGGGLFFCFF